MVKLSLRSFYLNIFHCSSSLYLTKSCINPASCSLNICTRIYNILLVNVTNFFARYPSCWSLFSFWIMYTLRYGLAKKIRIALTDERSVWNLSHIIILWEACVDSTNGKPIYSSYGLSSSDLRFHHSFSKT